MPKSQIVSALLVALFLSNLALARRDFKGIKCGGDLAAALIGRKMTDRNVAQLAKENPALALKNLRVEGLKRGFHTSIWRLCDETILLLERGNHVVDAVRIPPVSEEELPVNRVCSREGKPIEDVIAMLRPAPAGEFNASQAWQIDYKKKKLVPLITAKVSCAEK